MYIVVSIQHKEKGTSVGVICHDTLGHAEDYAKYSIAHGKSFVYVAKVLWSEDDQGVVVEHHSHKEIPRTMNDDATTQSPVTQPNSDMLVKARQNLDRAIDEIQVALTTIGPIGPGVLNIHVGIEDLVFDDGDREIIQRADLTPEQLITTHITPQQLVQFKNQLISDVQEWIDNELEDLQCEQEFRDEN